MQTVFSLEAVELERGGNRILDQVDWRVSEGEHWVVLGPNGAGKTSLVQILLGQIKATGGKVELLGEALTDLPASELARTVGFTSSALAGRIPGQQSALDLVLAAAHGRTRRFDEEYEELDLTRARDLLSAFGVGNLADRKFATLSGGEKQRVLIARAFMADPQVLILDEPSSGLDLGAREMLLLALEELARDPRSPALVVVTHHLEEIPLGFNHALLLSEGRVQAAGRVPMVLTDENLSRTFALPLEVGQSDGRWWAHGRRN